MTTRSPGLQRRHAGPDLRDHAHAFVADDDAGRGLVRRRHGQNIQVGAADAARLDRNEHIVIRCERGRGRET